MITKRHFELLRLSVTKKCNFACSYCAVDENVKGASLSYLEYSDIVKSLSSQINLKSVRLTGGEPTLYSELVELVGELKSIGIKKITLTTNAFRLAGLINRLKDAGLDGINISFDALDRGIFNSITKTDLQDKVLLGIKAAVHSGIDLKINCTLIKGVNDKEVLPLLDYFGNMGIPVRFLELMKMGHLYYAYNDYFCSQSNILDEIKSKYSIYKLERKKHTTSNYWMTMDGKKFGIIANTSSPFCHDCNRLRIDSAGVLYGCLSSERGVSIRALSGSALKEVLQRAIKDKQDMHFSGSPISMQAIGG